jgi:NAD(P)-dependent dehydrogenase (short-subunit alcohol dehydrogenase family)
MLEGRTIILSGVGPSLGLSSALMCTEEGANVVLAARTKATLDSVAEEVAAKGGTSISVVTDMNKSADCKRLVAETVARFGRVDGLVAIGYRINDKMLTECDDDLNDIRPVMDTNFFGTLQVIKPVIEQMMRQEQGGNIVIINSMTSHLPWPRRLVYAGSKAALASATRTLATEFGPHKIRVNSLHAGAILNDECYRSLDVLAKRNGTTRDEEYKKIAGMGALGFMATPDEYMGSVLYLLSDMSKPVTGISLHVNAGRYMA